MRLWHQALLEKLPRQQLLGQHRECAALRGCGWGKKHKIVDYVFTHNPAYLVAYHYLVIQEMKRRGYRPDPIWECADYRGKTLGNEPEWVDRELLQNLIGMSGIIYPEHNETYLQECLDNLRGKGIEL